MAIHYRTQGIILKKNDRKDSDQFLTVYTKDFGKVEVLAKAVKKITSKLRGGSELLYLSEIEFIQGKNHKTLTDAILIDKFSNLRRDLRKLQTAFRITDALDQLSSKEEKENKVWDLLTEAFHKLDDKGIKLEPAVIYHYFLWNLLLLLGYEPELHFCGLCRKKLGAASKLYFNSAEGVVVCGQCYAGKKDEEISQDAVKVIRLFIDRNWPLLARIKIDAELKKILKRVSERYFSEISGRN